MRYESVENVNEYQKACSNIKQIAKAIKAIKIKYYTNFSKISEQDRDTFDKLNKQMEIISSENGLNKLAESLMEEIDAKYSGKTPEIYRYKLEDRETRNQIFNEILLACYGAIDAGKQALSVGKLKSAIKCQEKLQEYSQIFDMHEEGSKFREIVTEYKRKKFGELALTKEQNQILNEKYEGILKGYFESTTPEERENLGKEIAGIKREKTKERDTEEVVL